MTTPDPSTPDPSAPGPDPAVPDGTPSPDDATSGYAAPPPPEPPTPAPIVTPMQPAPPAQPGAQAPGEMPPSWGPPATPTTWAGQEGRPLEPPGRTTRPGLVAGIILVVIGAAFLLARVVDVAYAGATWPLWIVIPGVAMLVGSFFIPPRGGLGLAIPGAIVTMVGLVLWVQDYYGIYATWAYAWALVAPTGPGLGMLLYGMVHRDRELASDGFRTTLVGIGLFLGFALFFEGVIGLSGHPIANIDDWLPYAAIAFGAVLVVLSLFGGGNRRDRRSYRS